MGTLLLTVLYLASSAALALAARLERRPSLGAVLVLTLLPLAFTASGWTPGKVLAPTVSLAGVPPWTHPDLADPIRVRSGLPNPLLADALSQMEPWREAARRDPLFNPSASAGAALAANAQSAVLFPPELVARLLPPVRATVYVQAARLLIAAWGLFLLLRFLAVGETAALAGAAVFTGSGFLQLWRLHPHASVAALTPWIVWATLRLVDRPGLRPALALAVLGALGVFAGHPETLAHSLLLALLAAAARLVTSAAPRRRLAAVAGWGAGAALLAALLAAPLLLPFVDNLRVSAEWKHRSEQPPGGSLPVAEALERLAPTVDLRYFGDPLTGTWHGPENLAEIGGAATSLVALALIPAALASRRRRTALAWLLAGAFGLAAAAHLPGISEGLQALPLLGASLLKRLALWWALAVAVLAGLALDALLERAPRAPRRALVLGAAAVALAAGLLVVASSTPRSRLELGLLALPLLLAPLLAWWPRIGGSRGLAAALWMLCLLAPPAAFFGRWVPLSAADSFYPTTPAVDFVRERAAGYRVAGLDSALVPHSAVFYGLEDVRGYDPMVFAPYADFVTAFSLPRRAGWARIETWSHPALDFLGVRFLFDHPSMYIFHHPGTRQVWEGEDALVYENPRAFERLFAPAEVEVRDRGADLATDLEAARAITDFAALAVARGPGLPPPGRYPNGKATVEDVAVDGGHVSARVEATEPVLIASSQPAVPGWRAFVDGEEAELIRVNGAFLGFLVAQGEHRVELVYAPASWRWGWTLFALGTVLAVIAGRVERSTIERRARETS